MQRLPIYVIAILSLAVAMISYRFLVLGLIPAFSGMIGHITDQKLAFLMHIGAAPIALALGTFQFAGGLRSRFPAAHRWSGRVYVGAILVGGVSALFLSVNATDRPVAAAGFGALALVWITSTAIALRFALARDLRRHRAWMIRSFALTFAAVTLRVQLPFFFIVGEMDYMQASNYVAWLCWVPNILAAEWYIRVSARGSTLRKSPPIVT